MKKLKKENVLIYLTALLLALVTQSLAFRFAWLTDTHVSRTGTGKADLCAAVQDINRQNSISFVIVSGDITDINIDNNLLTAKTILDSLTFPYYIIPGNHDTKWSDTGNQNFIRFWGNDKFVFDYEGIKFIGLHQGPVLHMTDGHFSPNDLRWLDSLLQNLKDKNQALVFITHYPIDQSIDNYYAFLDQVKSYNVRMILHGHGHRNRVENFAGIPGVMARSSLRGRAETGGYTLVDVKNDSIYFSERLNNGVDKGMWYKTDLTQATISVVDSQIIRPDYSVNESFPQVQTEWQYNTHNLITGSPIVGDEQVFIADEAGFISALDLKSGKEQWQYKCPAPFYATGAYADKIIIFPCTDGFVYAMQAGDGKELWKLNTGKANIAVPVIHDGIIYLGGSDHIFRAVSLKSGKILWEFHDVSGYVQSKALIYKDKVIFGAWDRTLYALNIADGSLDWKWSEVKNHVLYSPAACWPVGANGKIYIASPDRYLNAIEAATGKTVWRSDRFKVRESVGLSEDSSRVYAKCMRDTVFAVSTADTTLHYSWIKNFKYGYDHTPSMIAEKNGVAYFSVRNGLIIAFRGSTGQIIWKHKFGNTFINNVQAVDENSILISNMDGRVALLVYQP